MSRDPGIDRNRVAALADERLTWRFKAIPPQAWGRTVAEYLAEEPDLGSVGTPLLTLDATVLEHNLRTMATWCAQARVQLAPHGKTTMAPSLWERQLDAGACAITLANLAQVRVGRAFGLGRIHLANAVVDPDGLRWLATELDLDDDFAFTSWVDSADTVALMHGELAGSPPRRQLDVCVELGAAGGRTGARTVQDALAVAMAVHTAPHLRLVGVAGYEGALAHDAEPSSLAAIENYLGDLLRLHDELRDRQLLAAAELTGEAVVSAGGSAYFDSVADVLAPATQSGTTIVIRAGAYLIHDDGFYSTISPFSRSGPTPFRSAMHGWARVISRPEPELALLDGGKRDFPYDEGLPQPQFVRGRGPLSGRVTALNDQHAFLRGADVSVGDVVRLGLSHPCTALDKWSLIPVVDNADQEHPKVVDLVRTFF